MDRHLVIFARAPRIGAVKRRLAAGIGEVAAWRFAFVTADRLLRRLAVPGRWRCWLAVTPDRFQRRGRFWPEHAGRCPIHRLAQGPGDLGRRMARVLASLPPGPVVIIGTDIPDITPGHISSAFRALGRNQVVFGPAEDGGYWLVGARRRPKNPDFMAPRLFKRVRWSTSFALADSRANLAPGIPVALLETLSDIDDCRAFERWRQRRR
ncbi:MAG: TIGR04282 family arsenosugar biosynthesis glycosyltransferase [Alphaproteobacteria bacterium]